MLNEWSALELLVFLHGIIGSGGTPAETLTVTGVSPLSLLNAVAHSLVSLKQYGKCEQPAVDYLASVTQSGVCEQESGASPATPKDIKCNNGIIKVSRNLCDVVSANISVGQYIDNSGVVRSDVNNFYYTPYIPVTAGGTYTMSMSESVWYFSVSEYDANGDFLRRDLYGSTNVPVGTSQSFTVGADCASIRFGSNMTKRSITESDVLGVTWMLTETAEALPYRPYKEIYYDGTPEQIVDAFGNTATAPPLLGVGSYADTLEFLAGALGRQVGIKVLDGTETWVRGGSQNQFYSENAITDRLIAGQDGFCTHFVFTTNTSDLATAGYMVFGSSTQRINFSSAGFADVAAWTAYLAAQYRAGTPVIGLYPLATATTESVTGQMLVKAPLTVTAEVTVPTLATTMAAVSTPDSYHPLPIWCNNGKLTKSANLVDVNGQTPVNLAYSTNKLVTNAERYGYYIKVKPNTKYTVSINRDKTAAYLNICDTAYEPANNVTVQAYNTMDGTVASKTITTKGTTNWLYVYTAVWPSGYDPFKQGDFQIEEGQTATTFHPFVYAVGTPETLTVSGPDMVDDTPDGQGSFVSPSASTTTRVYKAFPALVAGATYKTSVTGSFDLILQRKQGSSGENVSGWVSEYTFTTESGYDYGIAIRKRTNASITPSGFTGTISLVKEQTATVVDLLGLTDDYRDTHELIHGPVTRDVGFMAVDGYEGDWVKATSGSNVMFYRDSNLSAAANVSASGDIILCEIATHYKNSWTSGENKIVQRSNKNFGFMNPTGFTVDSTVEDWENFCKAHPFLVFYPLATEGTESTTPQPLHTVQGTNVVSVEAEVDGITLEVQFKGHATEPEEP